MSTAYFISDLHLTTQDPDTLGAFQHFIQSEAIGIDALYILGDLFEAWIGDDDSSACSATVAKTLQGLKQRGTKIYYLRGNRDFLLGEDYAEQCGMTILPDPSVIELGGKPVLLTHGDLLCTDDKAYQRFRSIVQQAWLQKLFLALPLSWRQKVAGFLRGKSKAAGPKKSAAMMDVNTAAVQAMMREHTVDLMIHGHTHRPAEHTHEAGKRYVLGAWDEKRAVLKYEDGAFDLLL
jgi:UDP-2,3-diacylglucosamine hydrolase